MKFNFTKYFLLSLTIFSQYSASMEDISDDVSKEYKREIKDYDDFIQNVAFYKSDKKSPELAPKEYINRYKFVKDIKLPKIDLSFNDYGKLDMFHTDKYINNVNFFTKHVLPYISKKEFCYFYSMLVSKLLPNGLPKDFNYQDFLGITVILYYLEFGDIYKRN